MRPPPTHPPIPPTPTGYAGVAIYSKVKPLETMTGVGGGAHDGAGRLVAARFAWGTVASVYAPNSGGGLENLEYRTSVWDGALRARLGTLAAADGGRLLALGDFNTAFHDADVAGYKAYRGNGAKTACFTDAERNNFAALLASGFRDPWRDANPGVVEFTYFSTRQPTARGKGWGWRIDYALASPALNDVVVEQRATFPFTDHLPVVAYVA